MNVTLWIYRDSNNLLYMHYSPHCPTTGDPRDPESDCIQLHLPMYGSGWLGAPQWGHPWPEQVNSIKCGEMVEFDITLRGKWKIPASVSGPDPVKPTEPVEMLPEPDLDIKFWKVDPNDCCVTQTDTTVKQCPDDWFPDFSKQDKTNGS